MYFLHHIHLNLKQNRWISHLKTKKREEKSGKKHYIEKKKKYQYILIYNRYYIITEYYINIWCYIYINYFYYVRLQSLLEESILSTYSYDPCGFPRISMYIHTCACICIDECAIIARWRRSPSKKKKKKEIRPRRSAQILRAFNDTRVRARTRLAGRPRPVLVSLPSSFQTINV